MTVSKHVLFLVVWTLMWTFSRGDTVKHCVFMESCILPCSFQRGAEEVIHWVQVEGNIPVHSYYRTSDQLARQDQRFKGRTSLFENLIPEGNASLQLMGVQVQDEGRYKCYTSTITGNKESFVDLKVDAPVHEVSIQQEEDKITCSSEGIYPKPELTWSTSPPSNVTLKDTTTVQQTEQQLFNINSFLILSDNVPDVDYSCTISTDRNKRRATLFKSSSVTGSDAETTLPCTTSNIHITGLIWRFNNSHIILNQTGSGHEDVASEWKEQVKDVSESGRLTLQDLTSDHEGKYTCEVRNAEETYITNTLLRIEESQGSSHVAAAVCVPLVIVIITLAVIIYWKCYKGRSVL